MIILIKSKNKNHVSVIVRKLIPLNPSMPPEI